MFLTASPSISEKKCGRLPVAGTPKLALSGLAFSQATRCDSSRTGTSGPTATANSIEGGTSEVQLNIVSKRILGLPGA